jgi:hypothetical protein
MHVYTQMKYREKYNLQKRRIFLFLSQISKIDNRHFEGAVEES